MGQIENKNKEIVKLQEKIKELSIQYRDLINENKFRDFLLRIFKKKYKQPKGSDGLSKINKLKINYKKNNEREY